MIDADPALDGTALDVVASTLAELGPLDVHALYKLRVDVFVAEQDCSYAEIDDVDADPGTTHLLARTPDGGLVATLRVFGSKEPGGVMHIGRVCTTPAWRRRGVASRMIRRGLELCGDGPVEIGAQSYLERWYEQFGFVRCGPDYLDGRIPHLPMRRDLLG
ncbi:GNAT family N-acetyltransferase [Dietzia sp. ANT_WB102]|uniref:GNAT family N-acetyltransferase n=1 Tax=Dietzia sp. ANT_WB102 TaxID=2597345 RepID=UPI0011EDC4A1|nr:GNAT family N-acetyltransferase [Dietzia sp. ANT_WB102]KAA0918247.1 GNAT family N-acetyltransferase [Dietzia sp. ANT_WB102]